MHHPFIRVGLFCIACAFAGCSSGSSVPSPPSSTVSSGVLQQIGLNETEATAVAALLNGNNPCSTGSLGLTEQITGSNFVVTIAPVNCLMLGWTINGAPSVIFTGTYSNAARDTGTGIGPVGSFTMVSAVDASQKVSCTVSPPGQNFTFSTGQHGSQTGGPYVCNGVTYMLPADTW